MKEDIKIAVRSLNVFYGKEHCLRLVTLNVFARSILGMIGPASAGKTTFLRSLNRMNDLNQGCRTEGQVLVDGEDIYHPDYDVIRLRKRIGMVFALPVALPLTIRENVLYGPRLSRSSDRSRFGETVEQSLRAASLWDEVKDRLNMSALRLSGGQQQRLCLARVLAMEPEIILLDEPCSGLDPISTAKIEEALTALKSRYTIILVTNNTKQAARVADNVAFMLGGELVEIGPTAQIFEHPVDKRTNDYVTGRFG